jgi:ribokinase
MTDVAVVGSINHDLTLLTTHHPRPGETVLGLGHYSGGGGKGANQAVAAARAGAAVAMIGTVGDDDHGRGLVRLLEAEGLDTTEVGVDPAEPTGLAVITLDEAAENVIVVSPGANHALGRDRVAASRHLAGAKVVLAQLEVPIGAVDAAAKACTGLFCLNPAPAQELAPELLARVDVLVVNRSELGALTGVMADRPEWAGTTARLIEGPKIVVVTMGGEGAVMVAGSEVTHLESPTVEVVDTTGAGDAFCGVLAAALAGGIPMEAAVRRAVAAGALATTRPGAQAAMPRLSEIEALLGGD